MACSSNGSSCHSDYCMRNEPQSPAEEARVEAEAKSCGKCGGGLSFSLSTLGGSALCAGCFRSNVYGKFRLAVTSHAMIAPSDNVLVAFSGGPASRVALQFVHELQQKKQESFDASQKALRVFGVSAVFVDERAVYPDACDQFDKNVREMRSIVLNLSPPTKHFHVIPIENIYSSDSGDEKLKLMNLLNSIKDETGKEDLLKNFRMMALQKIGIENGYTKIILGSCTSRIARHVIAATVKGNGYSLSADIHYVDARWVVPVVLPLRDCTSSELNSICDLDWAA